ncbi:MAG: hypothetical protein IRY85_06560, partial [Micromonosporaceae bacterium]|nr:hypothetical protein [Micromonosporaceae bacterium]
MAVIAVLAAAAATAVLLEPWKKKANLPLQIGTLALSTRELPWPIAQALIPAHNLLTPPGADTWWAATYEDLANGRQLVDVFIAPLGNPNPSARVEELFQAFTTGSSEYTFSLVNVHAVNAFPATMSASCGEQDINEEDTDVAHMIIGDPVYIYKHL